MAEPENHTLHLLREIREDIRKLDRKVDANHDELKDSLDGFVQMLSGEIADRVYASGGVERKLVEIERRLTALERDGREGN
jgi:hypothetical protein